MKRIAKILLIVAIELVLSIPASAAQPMPSVNVREIATDFVRFWDATTALPTAARVDIFKRDVVPLFPSYYGLERFKGKLTAEQQDARIASAIVQFGPIRSTYTAKVAQFAIEQSRHLGTFMKVFPDFKPDAPVYLLHSLGEMDGGTRELDGRSVLIFGADVMAQVHQDWRSEAAFFHHELFHVYHVPKLGSCDVIWCSLWAEGLAVYVASVLNPEANHAELMLNIPAGVVSATEAAMVPSLESLRTVLASEDMATYADLFKGSAMTASALPLRRGYYLGFLVAQEVARGRDLQTLARLNSTQALPLVTSAIDKLLAEARRRHWERR